MKALDLKIALKILILLLVFTVIPTYSQNTVVVVPLLGNDTIRLERISIRYDVNIEVTNCDTYGDKTCFEGFGIASCPVDKKVIGGGAYATFNGRYGHINVSRPTLDYTGWECRTTYDVSSFVGKCYAICVTTNEVEEEIPAPKLYKNANNQIILDEERELEYRQSLE